MSALAICAVVESSFLSCGCHFSLRRRLADVEKSLGDLRVEAALRGARPAEPARAIPVPAPAPQTVSAPEPASLPPKPVAAEPDAPAIVIPERAPPKLQIPAPPAPPDFVAQLIDRVKRWFTEGNVPVKVGIVVSFFGVGALLKYAADSGWLVVPIELRLLGIAAAALVALVFAWRKRDSHRAFASRYILSAVSAPTSRSNSSRLVWGRFNGSNTASIR